jgi:hypothetical protein
MEVPAPVVIGRLWVKGCVQASEQRKNIGIALIVLKSTDT